MILCTKYIPITVMRTYQCYTYISVTLAVQCSKYFRWLCHCRLSCNCLRWASMRTEAVVRWPGGVARGWSGHGDDLGSIYCTCSLMKDLFTLEFVHLWCRLFGVVPARRGAYWRGLPDVGCGLVLRTHSAVDTFKSLIYYWDESYFITEPFPWL